MLSHGQAKNGTVAISLLFARYSPKKMRSPNYSGRSPLTRDLSGLGFVELQNVHGFICAACRLYRFWKRCSVYSIVLETVVLSCGASCCGGLEERT